MPSARSHRPAQDSAIRGTLRFRTALFACAIAISAVPCWGTAFFINQQSVKGLGRVDSGNTAAADDLGTIFFNPAGLTELWREKPPGGDGAFSYAVHLVVPRGTQRNAGSNATALGTAGQALPYAGSDSRDPTNPTPIPNLYYAKRLSDRMSVGLGINAPFGLRAEFSPEWFGRYDAIEASLRTVNASLVGAYRIGTATSIGAGLNLQYARTTLTTAIPNPFIPGGPTAATDARVATKGDAYTPGFNIGMLHAFDRENRVGLHYRSGVKHRLKGNSEITGLAGPLAIFNGDIGARADLELPAIVTAGFRTRPAREWVLMGDVQWYDWSAFKEVRIRFEDGRPDGVRPTNYRDTYGIALGVERRAEGSRLTTRAGLHYDRTPTVDAFRDTTVPDSDRVWVGLGATYHARDAFEIDFAFNHVFFRKTDINLTRTFFDGTPVASRVVINAEVKTVVNTIAMDLRWRF